MYDDRELLVEKYESLRRQLRRYHRVLLQLEEQRAGFGLHPPVDILTGIEETRDKIEDIEAQLTQIQTKLDSMEASSSLEPSRVEHLVPVSNRTSQTSAPHPPQTNPFALRSVIREHEAFVGRRAELEDIYSRLAVMQSCSIVGPRHIGKSSLLYYVTHSDVYRAYLPDAEAYVFGFMDLRELATLEPDDFFLTAVEQLDRAAQSRLNINLERDGTKSGFRRFLMRSTDAGFRLVLCCDEFEMLSQNSNFGVDFFTYLRGLCSNYDLALITSSRASLFDLCHQGNLQSSQFWNVFVERTLGLMPEAEATALVQEPFAARGQSVSPEETAFVLDLAGWHPFFIQIACYHLFATHAAGTEIDLSIIAQKFYQEMKPHCIYIWDHLEPEFQSAIISIAKDEAQSLAAHVFRELSRAALVQGVPEEPCLISKGWRRFVRDKAALTEAETTTSKLTTSSSKPVDLRENELTWPEAEYVDFEFKIEQLDSTTCRVVVLDSPAGQDKTICRLPFDLDGVRAMIIDLGQQITRGSTAIQSGQMSPAELGSSLFKTIFSGPVSQLFFESMGRVHHRQQGLRLKIHVDPESSPQLAALPWEYLYNKRRRSFLSLSRLTPVIRYLDVQAPTSHPPITAPLRVLVVVASPDGLPILNLVQERDLIIQAWGGRSDILVEFLEPATPAALQSKLWAWQPHILHFMGHGQFDPVTGAGALLFVDHDNKPKPIVGAQLGSLLSNVPSVRLAFLNACQSAELSRSNDLDPFSGVAAALVMSGLPAVIAMQFPISDRAALAFANGVYPHLAKGKSIELAIAFGREAIRLEIDEGNYEWGTPVLFMRVSDGQLFKFKKD